MLIADVWSGDVQSIEYNFINLVDTLISAEGCVCSRIEVSLP